MRTFVTFEFDSRIKSEISKVQGIIRQNSLSGRFKHIDNFHLTVKFLGETDNSQIEKIYRKMETAMEGCAPFRLNIGSIGVFGTADKIKTLYIKAAGEIEQMYKIFSITDEITANEGFKKEARFSPHITIAQNVILKKPFKELEKELNYTYASDVTFSEVVIMKSEQIGNKRVYTPIKTITLKG